MMEKVPKSYNSSAKASPTLRVLISGGGTGGHIFPALAVAHELRRTQRCKLLFVGARGRMEMEVVRKAGFSIVGLPMQGFRRRAFWRNVKLPLCLIRSLWGSRRILRTFKPDILFSTGSYASLPISYVGAKKGFPVVLLEPNAVRGLTSRLLAKHVRKVCVSYQSVMSAFNRDKVIWTGTPLRRGFYSFSANYTQAKCRKQLGLEPDRPTILFVGGTLGAGTFNTFLLTSFKDLLAKSYQVIWQTGKAQYQKIKESIGESQKGLSLLPFFDDILVAYGAASLIVSRAGAGAIAELLQVGKPTFLIPARLVDDHQRHNAEALASTGAVRYMPDQAVEKELLNTIKTCMENATERHKLSQTIAAQAPKTNATQHVIKELLECSLNTTSATSNTSYALS